MPTGLEQVQKILKGYHRRWKEQNPTYECDLEKGFQCRICIEDNARILRGEQPVHCWKE